MHSKRHHPVFYKFNNYDGELRRGFLYDFLGVKQRAIYYTPWMTDSQNITTPIPYPSIDENYFEYIDVLEAVFDNVSSKRDSFTMFDLGAGWGRWLVIAATALAKLGKFKCNLVGVEADPAHFQFMKLHFIDNNLLCDDHCLLNCAVWSEEKEMLFSKEDPFECYGQSIVESATEIIPEKFRSVRAITLSSLLKHYENVDSIHMDIQGAELDVILSSINEINEKVWRMHIGTHSKEIEDALCCIFLTLGWKCTTMYGCNKINSTPFGDVSFVDGIQTWQNMNLIYA